MAEIGGSTAGLIHKKITNTLRMFPEVFTTEKVRRRFYPRDHAAAGIGKRDFGDAALPGKR